MRTASHDPLDACAEIRAAIGVVALLAAGGELSDADMRAAVTCVEQELRVIELTLQGGTPGVLDVSEGDLRRLPVMTLAEVAAEARAPKRCRLQLVQGGKA